MLEPTCRIYGLLARTRRMAVLLRRGPSKQVAVIRWWLGSDTFEVGQWFKGRIYERRCDLSPDGDLMVYFAQDFGRVPGSWTAVSRPPYLTALCMWGKGDCWGGGGLFDSPMRLRLNHRPGGEMKHDGRFKLPRRFRVEPLGKHSGWGEDDPIFHLRQVRDGWWLVQEGASEWAGFKAEVKYPFDPFEIYGKAQPGHSRVVLWRVLKGIGEREGPWYQEEYQVSVRRDRGLRPPEAQTWEMVRSQDHVDWADWDENGDLLVAAGGCLYRLARDVCEKAGRDLVTQASMLGDFREMKFRRQTPPLSATKW